MTLINPTDDTRLPQIQIMPSLVDPEELLWLCKCKLPNPILKKDMTNNRAFTCNGCGYTWTIGIVPDDIRHFVTDKPENQNINQRPRIVRQ